MVPGEGDNTVEAWHLAQRIVSEVGLKLVGDLRLPLAMVRGR